MSFIDLVWLLFMADYWLVCGVLFYLSLLRRFMGELFLGTMTV